MDPDVEMPDPQLFVDCADQPLHFGPSRFRNFHVEGAGQMQCLDLVHPGEGELVVRPITLRDDRYLVFAGTLERQIIVGGDVFNHRKRIVPGINSAFEQGHAVSTLPLEIRKRWTRTRHTDTRPRFRPRRAAPPDDPTVSGSELAGDEVM